MSADEVQGRLDGVRKRIESACARAGRDVSGVRVVAVAKGFGPDAVREAADAGLEVIGESKVQEARQKIPLCPGGLEWHLVGHLQTNKVREAVHWFRMIHSVDSEKLMDAVDKAASAAAVETPVCIEVNVSGERSKFGVPPDALDGLLEHSRGLTSVEVVGLMTVPPFTPDPEEARPFFRALRERRDACRERHGIELNELSMGMSNDFEVAVEEGATMVRLGTVLFGERKAGAGFRRFPEAGADLEPA